MSKVLWTTGILVIFWTGALCAAKTFGTAQPNPLALWFANPDGSACSAPCLFGIMPGVTSYDDAVRLLARHPATRDMKRLQSVNLMPNSDVGWGNGEFCVSLRPYGTNVSEIAVSPDQCYYPAPHEPLRVTLGQVVTTLGKPVGVEVGAYFSGSTFFLNGKLIFEFLPDACGLSPFVPYDAISLLDTDFRHNRTPYWKGFSSRSYNIQTLSAAAIVASCRH